MFSKIGLAITFSPTSKALLKETLRLQKLFNSQLVIIHIGKKNETSENKLFEIIESVGLQKQNYDLIWDEGDPAKKLIKNCKTAKVDLFISGALEEEKLFKYFFGSVSRTIMHELTSTTLILKSPSEAPRSFKKFYLSVDYSTQSEKTIVSAYKFAIQEKAEEFVLIRDFHAPVLSTSIIDSGSINEIKILKQQWITEEKEKMKLFIKELNLTQIEPKIVCLYGKKGFESGNYARENNADIFIVNSPTKKDRLIDRLFLHTAEFAFEKLPSNLLIFR
ncbi:MAG: universal stress protein [Ignavibacteriae bacterium]|nr:universal stress protein [Ignavibacteriota bacterium]